MAKGRKTGGGSRAGKPNKNTVAKRALGAEVLPDKLEKALWAEFLGSEDAHIKWEAFKLAKQYKSGMPPKAPQDKDGNQTIIIQFKRDTLTPDVQTPSKPQI